MTTDDLRRDLAEVREGLRTLRDDLRRLAGSAGRTARDEVRRRAREDLATRPISTLLMVFTFGYLAGRRRA